MSDEKLRDANTCVLPRIPSVAGTSHNHVLVVNLSRLKKCIYLGVGLGNLPSSRMRAYSRQREWIVR